MFIWILHTLYYTIYIHTGRKKGWALIINVWSKSNGMVGEGGVRMVGLWLGRVRVVGNQQKTRNTLYLTIYVKFYGVFVGKILIYFFWLQFEQMIAYVVLFQCMKWYIILKFQFSDTCVLLYILQCINSVACIIVLGRPLKKKKPMGRSRLIKNYTRKFFFLKRF